jgi:F-type H+-transporting ATPase subunit b
MAGWVLLAAEGSSGGSFTDLKPVTAIWAWIAFLTTLFILSKVAWPGLASKMEARELRIAEGLRKAEEAEQRARELTEKQQELLAEARQEAQKLLADARAASENVKNDLLRQAQEEIGAERERAKREIELERKKAIDDLKQVTVDLTLEASARLLRRELRDEDHRRLAREVVEEVATRL